MASLKSKFILILFLVTGLLSSQTLHLDLIKGGTQIFNRQIYVFGFLSRDGKNAVAIYKLNFNLKKTDSIFVESPLNPESFLNIYADTLQDFLNVYLQQQDKEEVTIIRLDKQLKLVVKLNNVEIARLNNTSMFKNDALYFNKSVFAIVKEGDSLKQFYLNKYDLISEIQNFDYQYKWQFAFEKKDIEAAHIFYADRRFVYLFVWRKSEDGSGQWLLKINHSNGTLAKATKISEKGETNIYQFGNYKIDASSRSLILAGQKFSDEEFKEKRKTNLTALTVRFYIVEFDSLTDLINRQEFSVPVTKPTGVEKLTSPCLLRINYIERIAGQPMKIQTDIFKPSAIANCFSYANTMNFILELKDDKYVLAKSTISGNSLLESLTNTPDKMDMNGKICDEENTFYKLSYIPLTFPVKKQYKMDSLKNPVWIVSRSEAKKNIISYSYLRPVNKIYKIVPIENIIKTKSPLFFSLNATSFIISQQLEEKKYQLKLYNW